MPDSVLTKTVKYMVKGKDEVKEKRKRERNIRDEYDSEVSEEPSSS